MRDEKTARDAAKRAKLDRVTGGLAGADFGKDGKGIDNNMIDAILKDEYNFNYDKPEKEREADKHREPLKVANLVCDVEIPPPKKADSFDRWVQCDIIDHDQAAFLKRWKEE